MTEVKQSYDGGLSANIFFTDDYEKEFVEKKGLEWIKYRKEWDEYCELKKEAIYPPHLELELNYSCNLRCPMCTWSAEKAIEKKEDWFSFEEYKKIINDAIKNGTKSIRLCYINEPLIRTDLDQFIKYASDAGVLDIIITTNGTLLTKIVSKKLIEAGLTKISISLDAATSETYDKIRVGGDFKTTIKNINDFLEVRKELNKKIPKIRLSFATTKINFQEYEKFVSQWKGKVDSLGIQYVQNPFEEGKFKDESKKDLIMLDDKKYVPEKFHCAEPFKRLVLRSNGDVLPCCSFYAVEMVIGNWKKMPLSEIWNGEQMKELRRIHKKGDYTKNKICKVCVESFSMISD